MHVMPIDDIDPPTNERFDALLDALVAVRSRRECQEFLSDLCTPTELNAMASRWDVAHRIECGVPYRKIQQETRVSTATITRVARALSHGAGGYRSLLRRIKGVSRES